MSSNLHGKLNIQQSTEYPDLGDEYDLDEKEAGLISIHSSDEDRTSIKSNEDEFVSLKAQHSDSISSPASQKKASSERSASQIGSKSELQQGSSQAEEQKVEAQNCQKAFEDKYFDVQETMDFNDDLNASIRQKVHNPEPNFEVIQERQAQVKPNSSMNFCKKRSTSQDLDIFNEILEDCQRQSQNSDSRVSFSDLNEQTDRESFSDLNEHYHQSPHPKNPNFSKGKFKSGQQEMNKTEEETELDFWGPSETVEKSNINVKTYEPVSPQAEDSKEEPVFSLNKSIFTDRLKPKNNSSNSGSKKSEKPIIAINQEVEPLNQAVQQAPSLENSIYMQPVAPVKQKKPKSLVAQTEGKKRPSEERSGNQSDSVEYNIQITQMGNIYFLKFKSIEEKISEQSLNRVVEYFLNLGIMIPLFNVQFLEKTLEEKQNSERFDNQALEKSMVQKKDTCMYYLENYFGFICKKYPQHVKKLLAYLKESKGETLRSGIKAQGLGQLIFNKFTEYFKKRPYSKAEILKGNLEKKLKCIKTIEQEWFGSANSSRKKSDSQIVGKYHSVVENSSLKETKLQKMIAHLQMLISFESSELYCEKKLQEKLQGNIWKERKSRLKKDRNWYIDELFQNIQI